MYKFVKNNLHLCHRGIIMKTHKNTYYVQTFTGVYPVSRSLASFLEFLSDSQPRFHVSRTRDFFQVAYGNRQCYKAASSCRLREYVNRELLPSLKFMTSCERPTPTKSIAGRNFKNYAIFPLLRLQHQTKRKRIMS